VAPFSPTNDIALIAFVLQRHTLRRAGCFSEPVAKPNFHPREALPVFFPGAVKAVVFSTDAALRRAR